MSSHTFKLALNNGTLVIPGEAIEYLKECPGEVEISLTINSAETQKVIDLPVSDGDNTNLQQKWSRWFAEVDELEVSRSTIERDEYGKAIIEKYRKQGLEL